MGELANTLLPKAQQGFRKLADEVVLKINAIT